jgi:hypothetical protein
MANNTIQIRRSPSTAAPASLNAGELAYSNAVGGTGVLYIGSTDGATVVPIGGVRNPGTLTANQALVVNSTSGINRVVAANVDVLSYLSANGSPGTSGFILSSGGSTTNAYWVSPSSLTTNVNAQYAWTNTQSFSNTISFGSIVNIGNSTITTAANLVVQSNTSSAQITVANGTGGVTNTNIFPSGITTTGSMNAASFNTTTTVSNVAGFFPSSNALSLGNSTGLWIVSANSLTANSVTVLGGQVNTATFFASTSANVGANVQLTTTALTVTPNSTVNAIVNGQVILINGGIGAAANGFYVNAIPTGAVSLGIGNSTTSTVITGGSIQTNNIVVTGNLVVSGSVTTLNVATLVVNDNVIELAYNNLTAATDAIDAGFFIPANTSSVQNYSGIFRRAAGSTATNPYFRILATDTNPNTALTVTGTITTGFLESYLVPYGAGGAFVVNSSAVTVTASGSVAVNITANTLSLSTSLPTTSGGTGLSSLALGAILIGNGTAVANTLTVPASAANGQVLQITNNLPAYGVLDGGTF